MSRETFTWRMPTPEQPIAWDLGLLRTAMAGEATAAQLVDNASPDAAQIGLMLLRLREHLRENRAASPDASCSCAPCKAARLLREMDAAGAIYADDGEADDEVAA